MEDYKWAFYEYNWIIMEFWDGLVFICFIDGILVGVIFDWNGLCFFCYCLIEDNVFIVALEVGVLLVDQSKVVIKGWLQFGKIFIVDLDEYCVIGDMELKDVICQCLFYWEWLD